VSVQGFNPVFPVPNLDEAVRFWTAALGAEPTFVDGDRWAQFDVGGRRLALAGTDRTSDQAGVMVKVDDLEQAREQLRSQGVETSEPERGAHEIRSTAVAPGGWSIVLYAPLPG
jgi:catechol 2,3-dioxygenase-like lactoylglutathione lyase family enzyme